MHRSLSRAAIRVRDSQVISGTSSQSRELRIRCIEKYGGCCIRCGFADWRALQFDHVAGGGTQELKLRFWRGGSSIQHLTEIFTDKEGKFQLLCANCNTIKRCENGEGARSCLNDFYLKMMPRLTSAKSIW